MNAIIDHNPEDETLPALGEEPVADEPPLMLTSCGRTTIEWYVANREPTPAELDQLEAAIVGTLPASVDGVSRVVCPPGHGTVFHPDAWTVCWRVNEAR